MRARGSSGNIRRWRDSGRASGTQRAEESAWLSVLTSSDLDDTDCDSLPAVRAARNPNPAVLSAILHLSNTPSLSTNAFAYSANACLQGFLHHEFETPLIAAIKAQLPLNVRILLDNGADPNGYAVEYLKEYAREFVHPRNSWVVRRKVEESDQQWEDAVTAQAAAPMTALELEKRSTTSCHFWSGANYIPPDFYKGGEGMTAVEEACKHESPEILDMVLAASPDISFWTRARSSDQNVYTAGLSSLSITSPLHCAIEASRNAHVRRLLLLGFNPNATPRVCIQQSYTPLIAAICHQPPNWTAYDILLSHPETDRNLLTPFMKAHALHFAIAHLSVPIFRRVLASFVDDDDDNDDDNNKKTKFDISTIQPTAAGHTVLHIACLPPDRSYTNIFAESSYTSSHEYRNLPQNLPQNQYVIFDNNTNTNYHESKNPTPNPTPNPQPTTFFPSQTRTITSLLTHLPPKPHLTAHLLQAQDCHGNTAFHYLSLHRTVNEPLLSLLLATSEEARAIYTSSRNKWGWTAEELHCGNAAAEVEMVKGFWKEPCTGRVVAGGRSCRYL